MRNEAVQLKDEGSEALPALFGRLGDDLADLFDAKLTLLKIELRDEMTTYLRGMAMIAVGAVSGLVGFALLNVAFAFLVSALFQNTTLSRPTQYAIGFAITALVYLIGGTVLIVVSKNKIAAQNIVPKRTVAELVRDKERIEEEF